MKYDIFISYSRKDYDIVARICKELDKYKGISYFIDKPRIKIGNDFPEVIADAILNSRIFLLIASENSYTSKFTNSEVAFAHKNKSKDCIIPYIIDDSSLPIGLDLVLSSTDYKTANQISIVDLCRELSVRLNKKLEVSPSKIGVKQMIKIGYWIVFAILSYWICSSCVTTLQLTGVFDSISDIYADTLLWIIVCGWWAILVIAIREMIRESLILDDNKQFLLGIFGATTMGVLVFTPSITHSLYLHFQLKSDIKSEISLLHEHLSYMPADNTELKNELEAINNKIDNKELDILDRHNAIEVKNTIDKSYRHLKEYYTKNETNIATKQLFVREHSKLIDYYSIFNAWKTQIKEGLEMEYTISMIISIIIAVLIVSLINKL
ncbi:MAG: TIR domain-containing protein [Alistipes sp.]|nr:TIR domain-containing protein [Alistipes sp.]